MAYVALMVLMVFVSLFFNGVQMFKSSQLKKERDYLLEQNETKQENY